jgi:hypothetical protein
MCTKWSTSCWGMHFYCNSIQSLSLWSMKNVRLGLVRLKLHKIVISCETTKLIFISNLIFDEYQLILNVYYQFFTMNFSPDNFSPTILPKRISCRRQFFRRKCSANNSSPSNSSLDNASSHNFSSEVSSRKVHWQKSTSMLIRW